MSAAPLLLATIVVLMSVDAGAGPIDVGALIKKLSVSGRRQAEVVAWRLLDAGEAAVVPAAEAIAKSCDNSVITEALERVLKQSPEKAVAALAPFAKGNLCVVRTIGLLGNAPGVTFLIDALSDPSRDVRLSALDGLRSPLVLGESRSATPIASATAVTQMLSDSDPAIAVRAAYVAARFRSCPLERLLELKKVRFLEVRELAQEALGRLCVREKQIQDVVARALAADLRNDTECMGALRAIPPPAKNDTANSILQDGVAGALETRNAYCRIAAADWLAAAKWEALPTTLAPLLTKERLLAVRVALRGALFRYFASNLPTTRWVGGASKMARATERSLRAHLSGRAADESWLIRVFRREGNRYHRHLAGTALLKSESASARQVVVDALTSRDVVTRRIAVQAVLEAKLMNVKHALVDAVADEDWYVRTNAALALQEMTGRDFGTHAMRWKRWAAGSVPSPAPQAP